MSRTRFLLDENTPHAIRDQLLRRKPEMEVLVIGDDMAPALGTPDPELLRWVEREGYILVSRNRRTLMPGVHADFSAEGKLIGIEVIDATEVVGKKIEFALPEVSRSSI